MFGGEPANEVRPNKESQAEERSLVEAAQRDPARFGDLYEHYFERDGFVYGKVGRAQSLRGPPSPHRPPAAGCPAREPRSRASDMLPAG